MYFIHCSPTRCWRFEPPLLIVVPLWTNCRFVARGHKTKQIFAPRRNKGIKKDAMEAQGEHANHTQELHPGSGEGGGGVHVTPCEQMYHFHYLWLSWLLERDGCPVFLAWYGGRERAVIKMRASLWDGQDQAWLHQRSSQRHVRCCGDKAGESQTEVAWPCLEKGQ